MLVTNRSSPTSWTRVAEPLGQRASSRPSRPRPCRPRSRRSGSGRRGRPSRSTISVGRERAALVLEHVGAVRRRARWSPGRARSRRRRRACSRPPRSPSSSDLERLLVGRRGRARSRPRRRPRSRARARASDRLERVEDLGARSAAPRRSVGAPTGTIMNSWKSTELSACAPPLSMFIIGTGSTCARLAAEVAVERQARLAPRRPCARGQRDAEDRVRAEPRLVRRAVELDQRARRGPPGRRRRGRATASAISPLTLRDRLRDALAAVGVAAVAQLDRLELAGRGAGRHRGAAARARRRATTSTSTVGLPRESRIWRAWTVSIWLTVSLLQRREPSSRARELASAESCAVDAASSRRLDAPRKRSRGAQRELGSTLSLRATLTAANSTSPTSWKRSSRVPRLELVELAATAS